MRELRKAIERGQVRAWGYIPPKGDTLPAALVLIATALFVAFFAWHEGLF